MRISYWSSDVCSSDLAKESRLATANNESGRMLFSNRESYANQLEAQAFTNLNKVTTSGLHGVSGTSFNDAAPAFKGDRKSTRLNSITNAQLVCRLLLEKKKQNTTPIHNTTTKLIQKNS